MQLQPLTLEDKIKLDGYLKEEGYSLSSYAFASIFAWASHFEVLKCQIGEKFCIFYRNQVGCFMALPPLGGQDMNTVNECFAIMESINRNKDISRIENIEEKDLEFFKGNNFRIYEKSKDYIVDTRQMAELKGQKLKHKRNLVNFFKKTYDYRLRSYSDNDSSGVLALYERWMQERSSRNNEPVYQAMMQDSLGALKVFLKNYESLDADARVVESGGSVKAFTSGYPISQKLFCINFEIADPDFKGLSQFIFSEFAKELYRYPEINIMDDSGFINLRKTKLTYQPLRAVPSYTALLN